MSQNQLRYEKRTSDLSFRNSERNCLKCSPHLHREIELVCFFEGHAVAYADSVRCELEPGDVFIAFPNQIHYYESLGPERYYLFIVNPETMPELADRFNLALPHSPVIKGAAKHPRVKETIEALYHACGSADTSPFGSTMRQGYLLALFSELLCKCGSLGKKTQVSVEFDEEGNVIGIDTVVVSIMHSADFEMEELRRYVDEMETMTASDFWPLPSYGDMMFRV